MSYLNEINDIWEMVKDSLKKQYSETTAELWFRDLKIEFFDNNNIVFSCSFPFKYNVVKEKYLDKIEEEFSRILGFPITVELKFDGEQVDIERIKQALMTPQQRAKMLERKDTEEKRALFQNYNFEYTFDNFIVGSSNKFAHAACYAVAQSPASDYNPLFIYGPSGLGKTHLMSAVVNEFRKKNTNLNVLYMKGEDFTNELIESLGKREMHEFREKYRKCDILLIDDVQFIAGKESTQEEFFHTFNALYEDHKQIILSSDRPPKDIQTLEDRLKTRFEWGLIADIQPPDLELRVAIIKKKAEQISVDLSEEVLNFLAENLRSNIRQIEGAVRKLSALAFLTGKKITMETARACLAELLGGEEPVNVTVEKIFASVYQKFNVPKEDIIGQKRNKEIAEARHICVYLIREIIGMSYPNIGTVINRDHATILASYDKIRKKMIADPIFSIEVNEIIKEITGQA